MPPRLSLVTITRNEERNLPLLLRGVRGLADEVVVVDSHSEDRTVAIAQAAGAVVVPYPRTAHVDAARSAGLEAASGDWILSLDADEVPTPALAARIRSWLAADDADAYRVPRLNYAFGAPVLHGGWGPDDNRPLALFRRGKVAATHHVHDFYHPAPDARVVRPPYVPGEHILHFGLLSVRQHIEKVNRYSGLLAADGFPPGTPLPTPAKALTDAARRFAFHYGRLRGYRDGWRGLAIAALTAYEQVAAYAKAQERAAGLDEQAVAALYGRLADEALKAPAAPTP